MLDLEKLTDEGVGIIGVLAVSLAYALVQIVKVVLRLLPVRPGANGKNGGHELQGRQAELNRRLSDDLGFVQKQLDRLEDRHRNLSNKVTLIEIGRNDHGFPSDHGDE